MRRTDSTLDRRRLLGRLTSDPEWGHCVGFWGTTYQMQPEFFETDFLPALLNLGTWSDRQWTTRVAMERDLAQMEGAAVFVDAHGYQGRPRSLRVEIRAARVPTARLHAKVLIILHEKAVRFIVGSANLTEPGYRQNIEVALALTATSKRPEEAVLIREALRGAPAFLQPWWSETATNLANRGLAFIDGLDLPPKARDEWFLWSGNTTRLCDEFLQRWPADERIGAVTVVSPFWSEEPGDGPVAQVLKRLRGRGALADGAGVRLVTAAAPGPNGAWRPVLPTSYGTCDFRSLGASAFAQPVDPAVSPEETGRDDVRVTRTLHAKVVLFEGRDTSLAYLGSANFTQRGWGFPGSQSPNVEAGIILRRSGRARDDLRVLIPGVAGEYPLDGRGRVDLGAVPAPEPETQWPDFIQDIRLAPSATDDQRLELRVKVDPGQVNGTWNVGLVPKEGRAATGLLISAATGPDKTDAAPRLLSEEELKMLLQDQEVFVRWWAHEAGCAYPVNVAPIARDGLPISPDARRLEEGMLLAYYQARIDYADLFPPIDEETETPIPGAAADMVSGVDTSTIQSYQIREFVESLDGIRQDLRAASGSERAMRLALLGPVSPVALARLVIEPVRSGKRTPTAAGFQLVEILNCLDEAAALPGREAWEHHRQAACDEVSRTIGLLRQEHPADLGPTSGFAQYEARVRKEARQ